MKRIISILLAIPVIVSVLAFVTVSADGSVLFSDDFNSGEINEANWYPGAFFVENGGPTKSQHVEDYAGWHVLQSLYNSEDYPNRTFGANVAFKTDAWAYEDGGNDAGTHRLGLWWADYFDATGEEGRIIYMFRVCYETRKAELVATGEGNGEEYFEAASYYDGVVVGEWTIPDSISFEMDPSDPSVISLGMRINGTQIDCFINDQKAISYTAPRMGVDKSPVILVNEGCYAGFDNVVVSTADYNLFNESATPAPAPTPAETETEKVIETKVVHETDEEGNDVTVIVTEEVVRPAANTGGNTTGGTATKTGDSALIVIAILIVSAGAAIVVGKVGLKR